MRAQRTLLALLFAAMASAAIAQQHATAPYAGLERRGVASLSESDLVELRAGRGWGLALPAELNGVPGPTHLLELAVEIELSPAQISAVTDIRDRMRVAAIEAGEAFIASEQALNDAFVQRPPDVEALARLLSASGQARATLKLAHLSAHLETLPLLTSEQVATYNRLRGYAEADPCDAVPDGHDATMWRQHNGCG